jgi:chloramphenicol 3-O phosphotransferase
MSLNGRIIVLNGTSSSGKSTLAKALRPALPATFCYYTSDQLADAGFRPLDITARGETREAFFVGFHRSIAAYASAGLDLLIEHIVETSEWCLSLKSLLSPYDCFWVGVHAPLKTLKEREALRGDRQDGEAEFHLRTHNYCTYDISVDTTVDIDINVSRIIAGWNNRHSRVGACGRS